jgi:hypothetical protein
MDVPKRDRIKYNNIQEPRKKRSHAIDVCHHNTILNATCVTRNRDDMIKIS